MGGWGEPRGAGTTSEAAAAHELLDGAGIPPGTLAERIFTAMESHFLVDGARLTWKQAYEREHERVRRCGHHVDDANGLLRRWVNAWKYGAQRGESTSRLARETGLWIAGVAVRDGAVVEGGVSSVEAEKAATPGADR